MYLDPKEKTYKMLKIKILWTKEWALNLFRNNRQFKSKTSNDNLRTDSNKYKILIYKVNNNKEDKNQIIKFQLHKIHNKNISKLQLKNNS
jgi:hypothetical protein